MMPQQYNAVVFPAREQAELVTVPQDVRPLAPNEVAGKTLVSLISSGTELSGGYLAQTFEKPRTPGYAAVFEVEEVGSDVTDIRPGNRVFCMGHHQSFQCKPRDQVLVLPDNLAPEIGVFTRMMGVSMSTLTTTTARPPEKVVVTGLGVVGFLAAQIFAHCGYAVIACEPDARRREIAQAAGIQTVLPAVPIDDPEVVRQVGLVVECSGHEQAVLDGCRVVRKRGEVAMVGVPWRRRTEVLAFELLHEIFFNYVVLRSGWEWELPRQAAEFRTNSIWGNLAGALNWLAEGTICVSDVYEKRPPREAQNAYQELMHNRCAKLSVMFDWTDCP